MASLTTNPIRSVGTNTDYSMLTRNKDSSTLDALVSRFFGKLGDKTPESLRNHSEYSSVRENGNYFLAFVDNNIGKVIEEIIASNNSDFTSQDLKDLESEEFEEQIIAAICNDTVLVNTWFNHGKNC
ncbi:MAG: hypothetical protein K1060chlam2_00512 [Chlamydiae bacterium]|nr:hypothetical protein [Chlamydiota bacterium]